MSSSGIKAYRRPPPVIWWKPRLGQALALGNHKMNRLVRVPFGGIASTTARRLGLVHCEPPVGRPRHQTELGAEDNGAKTTPLPPIGHRKTPCPGSRGLFANNTRRHPSDLSRRLRFLDASIRTSAAVPQPPLGLVMYAGSYDPDGFPFAAPRPH